MKNKVILLGSVLLGTSWMPYPALCASDPNKVYTVRNGNRLRGEKRMRSKGLFVTTLVAVMPLSVLWSKPNQTVRAQQPPVIPGSQALPEKLPNEKPDKNQKIITLQMSQLKKALPQLLKTTFDDLTAKRKDAHNWSLKKHLNNLQWSLDANTAESFVQHHVLGYPWQIESKDKGTVAVGSIKVLYTQKPHTVVACCFVKMADYGSWSKPYVIQQAGNALYDIESSTTYALEDRFEQNQSYDDIVNAH